MRRQKQPECKVSEKGSEAGVNSGKCGNLQDECRHPEDSQGLSVQGVSTPGLSRVVVGQVHGPSEERFLDLSLGLQVPGSLGHADGFRTLKDMDIWAQGEEVH